MARIIARPKFCTTPRPASERGLEKIRVFGAARLEYGPGYRQKRVSAIEPNPPTFIQEKSYA
jgi:hypothetical protein